MRRRPWRAKLRGASVLLCLRAGGAYRPDQSLDAPAASRPLRQVPLAVGPRPGTDLQTLEVLTSAHVRRERLAGRAPDEGAGAAGSAAPALLEERLGLHNASGVEGKLSGGPGGPAVLLPDSSGKLAGDGAGPDKAGTVGEATNRTPAAGGAGLAKAGASNETRRIQLPGAAAAAGLGLAKAVHTLDLPGLQHSLAVLGFALQRSGQAFDVNSPFVMPPGKDDEPAASNQAVSLHAAAPQGPAPAAAAPVAPLPNASGLTLLCAVAQLGWLAGVQALVEWDAARRDRGDRLLLEAVSPAAPLGGTPLQLAVQARHAAVVRYLLSRGASVAVRDARGRTPLEVAAARGPPDLLRQLVGAPDSELADGLWVIRLRLLKAAEKLPRLLQRWPFGTEKGDHMDSLRKLVPAAFRPPDEDRAIVGANPSAWVLLYTNRVMCSLATSPARQEIAAIGQMERLLVSHGFDAFARGFCTTVVLTAVILGCFGVFVQVVFRLRVYGWTSQPVSLADSIPGAFNPIRLSDPDFDPVRQKAKLPYREAQEHFGRMLPSCCVTTQAFIRGVLGIYNAWLLLNVRIPPEKDLYDEDYLSEDDEAARSKVREHCSSKARCVRDIEVFVRCGVVLGLLWWLSKPTGRWGDALFLVAVFLYSAFFASAVATCTVPGQVPEKTPDDLDPREGAVDAARLVTAIFAVQHGPRWTRAICTTRSTAAPRRTRLRRPQRRGGARSTSEGTGTSDCGKEEDDDIVYMAALPGVAEGACFSDRFQRAFLQSGQLHVTHGELLVGAVGSAVLIAALLVWLVHVRRMLHGSARFFYEGADPAKLFLAYGAPGSALRGVAVAMELLFLALCGERLYGIASLLRVAALSTKQRTRALAFFKLHPPPAVGKATSGGNLSGVQEATRRVDECIRCCDFALELSAVRWAVLQEPVMLVFLFTLKAIGLALACFFTAWLGVGANVVDLLHLRLILDPMMALVIATCLSAPLLSLLASAAWANCEVRRIGDGLRRGAEEVLSGLSPSAEEAGDVLYVQLRVKAASALRGSALCWPGGRELGYFEPVLLVLMWCSAVGFAAAARAL